MRLQGQRLLAPKESGLRSGNRVEDRDTFQMKCDL